MADASSSAAATEPVEASPRREVREILRLAGPIMVAQSGLMAMGLVDSAIVGRMGKAQLAAVGLGHNYVMPAMLWGMGLIMGLDPVVTQRLGGRDARGAARALGDACRLALVALAPLTAVFVAVDVFCLRPNFEGGGVAAWFRVDDPEVARTALAYFWSRTPGLLPFMLFAAMRSWLYASHAPGPMLRAIVWGNVANAALDYVFVFGDEGLRKIGLPAVGLPAFGAVGAGVVTTVVNWLMAAVLAWEVKRRLRAESLVAPDAASPARVESHGAGMARIAKLGAPIGTQTVLECGIFNLVAVMMGSIGTAAQAAHQISIQLASFTFMATTGIGAAAAVRVGRSVGAGRSSDARRSGVVAVGLGVGWMALCAAALVFVPEALARCFTSDETVIAISATLLRIAAIFQIFDGVQSVATGALRGAGDTKLPFLANLAAYWLVCLPLALWLRGPYGAAGLWYGLTSGLVVVSILLFWRFLRLTSRTIRRVG